MEEQPPIDPKKEDQMIKAILIVLSSGAILTVLTVATIVAVMISYNFNFLEWME